MINKSIENDDKRTKKQMNHTNTYRHSHMIEPENQRLGAGQ